MLTVKHIGRCGEEALFEAVTVRSVPKTDASPAFVELLPSLAEQPKRLTDAGRYFVMNGAGNTVAKYTIEPSTENQKS